MKWQPESWAWRVPSVAAALAVLLSTAGLALYVIHTQTAVLPSRAEAAGAAVRRCSHCGWIESKREVPPAGTQARVPVAYEYTVRMADGSRSVFRETLPVSWRVGERLISIGGTSAGEQ
jgi:hypothetical protein